MALDNAKNFAKATVSTGYDASATSIVLVSGHGAKLPTAPFNAVWWNSSDYADPADDPNVEIVRVTNISTDTLTVTRAQESTTATAKNVAGKTYKIIAGATAKLISDIAAAIAAAGGGGGGVNNATITYNADGSVATVVDTDNLKTYSFTYNGDGSVATVSDGTNTWTLGYSNDHLSSITKT